MTHPQNPPAGATRGVWMRSISVSGTKDWLCFDIPGTGIETRWGKTGAICQSARKSGNFDTTVHSKERKGYQKVSVWLPQPGWSNASTPIPPAAPSPEPTPKVAKAPKVKAAQAENKLSPLEEWTSKTDVPKWF